MRGLLSAWSHRGVTVASEDYRDDGAALIELTLDDADVRAPFLREAEAAGAVDVMTIHNVAPNPAYMLVGPIGSPLASHREQSVGRLAELSTLPTLGPRGREFIAPKRT